MTDFIKTLDDALRRSVAEKRKLAVEHPFRLGLTVILGQIANALILHRLGRRWGLPLSRLHWWFLLASFGREPGYPYNLIWQVPHKSAPPTAKEKDMASALTPQTREAIRKSVHMALDDIRKASTGPATTPSPPRARPGSAVPGSPFISGSGVFVEPNATPE